MLIRHAPDIKSSEITPEKNWLNRRELMAGMGAIAATGMLATRALAADKAPALAPLPNMAKSPLSLTSEKMNTFEQITHYNNFYEFGLEKSDPADNAAKTLKPSPWTVVVDGECDNPGKIDVDQFIKASALEERIYRHRCVEAWSMVIPWVGVPLASVLKQYNPNSKAKFVQFQTLMDEKQMPYESKKSTIPLLSDYPWPYTEGLRIDEAMHPLTILAVGLYGNAMPPQDGAPIRLVVPWKYGFKGIKSIVSIKFTETRPKNLWNQVAPDEYGFYANVNPAKDHPRWSQATERRIGEFVRRKTLPFNGYADQVASLYSGQDLNKDF
jgi:sulfoxide reductase catalytic subunit YedY